MIGSKVGPYRIQAELGSGAMGSVYLARRNSDRRALKLLHAHGGSKLGVLRRFLREAAVGARIDHPNVVRTLCAGRAIIDGDERPYLVMEYVEGETLRELMDRCGPLSEPFCRKVARDVANGLAAIHAAGLVHRDLKPENIIVGDDGSVRVMDLGLVHVPRADGHDGCFRGSVMYAAPEQFAGDTLDASIDWYALGLVLYEMATGRHPSSAPNIVEVMHLRLDGAPARARQVNPALSDYFDELLSALLECDGARRLRHLPSEHSAWWTARRARLPRRRRASTLNRITMDWDEKHAARGDDSEPAPLLREYAALLPASGRALDIAAGAGRNAVFLAQAGLDVDAIDQSEVGLKKARALAAARGVAIRTIHSDLGQVSLKQAWYDVAINFYYLQRSLVGSMRDALKPGGLVFFETYTVEQLSMPGGRGPRRSEYLLEPGELRTMFDGYEILHWSEGVEGTRAIASLVARKPQPA